MIHPPLRNSQLRLHHTNAPLYSFAGVPISPVATKSIRRRATSVECAVKRLGSSG
jgi:hypothetical protein